jgi:hypothetical protein
VADRLESIPLDVQLSFCEQQSTEKSTAQTINNGKCGFFVRKNRVSADSVGIISTGSLEEPQPKEQ